MNLTHASIYIGYCSAGGHIRQSYTMNLDGHSVYSNLTFMRGETEVQRMSNMLRNTELSGNTAGCLISVLCLVEDTNAQLWILWLKFYKMN